MRKLIVVVFLSVGVYSLFFKSDVISLGPGIKAPDTPVQISLKEKVPFDHKGYTLTPLAELEINAKVLSRRRYLFGREAKLSPVDFALGWGRMSDEDVLGSISISQSWRWYRWYTKDYPIPRREIEVSSGNFHMIPSSESIKKKLLKVHKGEIVHIRGYLVRIDADDGWHWVSSLSREDTGSHSCEVFFVRDVSVLSTR